MFKLFMGFDLASSTDMAASANNMRREDQRKLHGTGAWEKKACKITNVVAFCDCRAQRQALATPGSALGGWKPRGSQHARIGSREAIFYDDDAGAKATPFPSSDRWACSIHISFQVRYLCSYFVLYISFVAQVKQVIFCLKCCFHACMGLMPVTGLGQ